MENLLWIVFFSFPFLMWAGASRNAVWWLPAVPVVAMGIVSLIAVIRYEPPAPGEEPPFLDGFEEFLQVAMTGWMGSAVVIGWAVRLWRSGRKAPAGALALAGVLPWVVLFAQPY